MKVNREHFLDSVKFLMVGVAQKDIIEQSTYIAFKNGEAYTYNDEIAVSVPVFLAEPEFKDLEFAVPAKELYRFLERVKSEEIDVEVNPDNMTLRTPRTELVIALQTKITLPTDCCNKEESEGAILWETTLFLKALEMCIHTTSTNTTRPYLSCVHITGRFIESCDGIQLTRIMCESFVRKQKNVDWDILVPAKSIKEILKLNFENYHTIHVSIDKEWIHFLLLDDGIKNAEVSCRLFLSDYMDLNQVIDKREEDEKVFEIPDSVIESLERIDALEGESFDTERATVSFSKNLVVIQKQTQRGRLTEKNRIKYDGEPFSIVVHPTLFANLLKFDQSIVIGKQNIRSNDDKNIFIVKRFREIKEEEEE